MSETDETTQRMTLEELKHSIEWEGGIGELIEYGTESDEVPEELATLWGQATVFYRGFLDFADQIDEVLYRE